MEEQYSQTERQELHETNLYEDTAFPIGMYVVTPEKIVPEGRGYRDLHWHEEMQFTLLTDGEMLMQVNGVSYRMQSGEAIFVNKNCLHMSAELSKGGRYVSFSFFSKQLAFFAGSRMEFKYVLPYTNCYTLPAVLITNKEEWMREILRRLWLIQELLQHKEAPLREYKIALEINTAWCQMIEGCGDKVALPEKNDIKKIERLKTMLTYVCDNYMKKIQIDDIATAACISAVECNRCFREIAGKSPKQYLIEYRVARAMDLLNTTEASITDIALTVGFNDTSYFNHYFKKITRTTTKDIRKQ